MTQPPSLNIEALARLDLRPDEILAVTLGGLDPARMNVAQMAEDITEWLAAHGQPVAGVMVLPQGSQLAALRSPEPVTHEQVERGEKSINDYRRSLGMPAFNIACAVIHRDQDGNVIPCPCFDCGGSRTCPACEGNGHRDGERCLTCDSLGNCPTCRDR